MIYPIGYRENSRYRGPIESIKFSRTQNDIIQNIKILYEEFDKQESDIKNLSSVLSINEFYNPYVKMGIINDNLNLIKEG